MQTSFYNTMFAALPQERRLNNIANNLANINTSGFKREKSGFVDVFKGANAGLNDPSPSLRSETPWPKPQLISQVLLEPPKIDFSDGPLQRTDSPLDLAIQGDGFFKIQTEEGVRYSRNGHFRLTEDGALVNGQGHQVLGEGGPIVIPEGATNLIVNGAGILNADGAEIAVLDLATLADTGILEKQGGNLFRVRPGEVAEELPFSGSVSQGALEGANIQVVEEMVAMIETLRTFESYQKVMSSTQEMDLKLIHDVGTTR
jgi:flagellar basal-body rod protein FlgF